MAVFNFFATREGLCVKHRKGFLLFFYTICYLAYIALGGFCFLLLEGPQDNLQSKNVANVKANFIKMHPCITEESLNQFLKDMSSFRIRSLNTPNTTAQWTYSQAVLFSVTLLTTIGYGQVVPVSPIGKFVCIVYTGLGIPMTLLLLAAYVQRLMYWSRALKNAFTCCFENVLKPFVIHFIHLSTIVVIIILLFFILPALLFSELEEGWSYLDALYFCFISLTTVGLGDYVPGLNSRDTYGAVYHLGIAIYVITGVTAMMFTMSITAEFHRKFSDSSEESQYPSEKIPIVVNNPAHLESYGSMLIENTKNGKEKDRKNDV